MLCRLWCVQHNCYWLAMCTHRSAPAILTSAIRHKLGLTVTIITTDYLLTLACVRISSAQKFFIAIFGDFHPFAMERPMFIPDATSGGFLLDFCLYCYKIKPFSHHFLPLIAVVCPSLTPSVDSGINRLQIIPLSNLHCMEYEISAPEF